MLGTLENGTDSSSSYDAAVELLKGRFVAVATAAPPPPPQRSALLLRLSFRQRRQLPGESVLQYVAELRSLAAACRFGTPQQEEEMIRDQLIEHTSSVEVRERLLLETEELSLSQAVDIAVKVESASAAECVAASLTAPVNISSQAATSSHSLCPPSSPPASAPPSTSG